MTSPNQLVHISNCIARLLTPSPIGCNTEAKQLLTHSMRPCTSKFSAYLQSVLSCCCFAKANTKSNNKPYVHSVDVYIHFDRLFAGSSIILRLRKSAYIMQQRTLCSVWTLLHKKMTACFHAFLPSGRRTCTQNAITNPMFIYTDTLHPL